jgi:hypothetical protein
VSVPDHQVECGPWRLTFLDELPQEDEDGEDSTDSD